MRFQNKILTFPKNFFWGAAASAHQVEGGNFNDWSEWENENSARLTALAASRHANTLMRIPDYILQRYPNPLQEENYISGRACDHYNRFEEDFDIAKLLGHNAHRLSIEWSRIEPEEGKWNEKEIEHYGKVIKALRGRGIEPFVTLWHWTLPCWLRDKGGVGAREFPKFFAHYAEKMARELGGDVRFWITINEPEIFSFNSYFRGIWPPQKKSHYFYLLKVLKNLVKAHKSAFETLKKKNSIAQIGIAKNNTYFEGWLAPIARQWWNNWFLKKIKNQQDFIGLNYYFHNRIKGFKFDQNENKIISDMGWEIYPEGVYRVLKDLKKCQKPIYITENGVADAKDIHREKFIKEHLQWIHKAVQEGVDVRGYFYWSLLDNFEWDKGFWPRFGLVEVDYQTMKRKIRPSAMVYAEICKNNSLEIVPLRGISRSGRN